MADQNYKNHTRFVPLYHYVTSLAALGCLGGSINYAAHATPETQYSACLLVLVSVVLVMLFWFCRAFALKAQDRAIRAEENFRHFILTGKPLDNKLSMAQIVGLRFASDAEFPALAQKTVAENLSQKEIKQSVKNWRADNNRA